MSAAEEKQALECQNLKNIAAILGQTERWPNGKLPCDYLVLDTETLGFSSTNDKIVQVGLCSVRDCKITHDYADEDYTSFIIKLPQHEFVGREQAIEVHGIDYERSQAEGLEPEVAYSILYDIVNHAKAEGMMVCGHNLYSFDVGFLQIELARMGVPFTFAPNEIIDTAMLVKAMQLGMLPGHGESSYAYWDRVKNFRAKGVYFNLDRYCMQRFKLYEKGAMKENAHDAGYDCWLTHLLVEELNNIITS